MNNIIKDLLIVDITGDIILSAKDLNDIAVYNYEHAIEFLCKGDEENIRLTISNNLLGYYKVTEREE